MNIQGDEDYVETLFLVPIREDKDVGTGDIHPDYRWEILHKELYARYKGLRRDMALQWGVYQDPDTLDPVEDWCREYRVAVRKKDLGNLKHYLRRVAKLFRQKSLYFTVLGEVEFIRGEESEEI